MYLIKKKKKNPNLHYWGGRLLWESTRGFLMDESKYTMKGKSVVKKKKKKILDDPILQIWPVGIEKEELRETEMSPI